MCIQSVKNFLKNKKGATAIEYGLIAGGISLAVMAAVFVIGSDLNSIFSLILAKMTSVTTKVQ